jgi:hypothetical protein
LYQRVTAAPPSWPAIAKKSVTTALAERRLPTDVLQRSKAERARQRATRTDLWRPVYTHPDDVTAFRAWLGLMYDPDRAGEMPGQPPRYGETELCRHGGFMTFRYFTLLADDRARLGQPGTLGSLEEVRAFDREHTVHDDMIRIEDLEAELTRVLKRAGYELDAGQCAELAQRCRTKTNSSPHLRDRDYFDDHALELVATRERFLIEKYGYEPPA